MDTPLKGILQLAIRAKDIDRATAFYRDALGLRFLFTAPGMAFFDCDGVRLYIDANPGPTEPGGYSGIYFRAGNIAQAHKTFQERAVAIHEPPKVIARLPDRDVWLMFIRDSEENLLGVMEERTR